MSGSLMDFLAGGGAQPAAAPAGGIFDAMGGGAPGGQQGGLQLAMQLSQNPTPETARQIIQQLHQMRNPEAGQFEQILSQVMDDPQALKQVADAVVQKLGGANA